MSVVISKRPHVISNGQEYKFNAAHHQIEFELTRQDLQTYGCSDLGGVIIFSCVNPLPPELVIGDTIYWQNDYDSVTAVVNGINGSFVFTALGALQSTQNSGGYINFISIKKNYHIETVVLGVNESNQFFDIGTLRSTPNPKGKTKIDVHELIKSQLTYKNEFKYNVLNKLMRGEGFKYQLKFREVYNGIARDFSIPDKSNLYYYVNAAKQIGDIWGFSMQDFTPAQDGARNPKAKFLSVFDEPTFFVGYPFSLSFIYSDNLQNYNTFRQMTAYNENNVIQNVTPYSHKLLITERTGVNRLTIGNFASNVDHIDVWLESFDKNSGDQVNNNDYSQFIFSPFTNYTPVSEWR